MTFSIIQLADHQFLLMVETFAGVNPVGTRLLRGAELPEKFHRAYYTTESAAKEAKAAWEQYRDSHITNEKRKTKSKAGGPVA